MNSGIVLVLLAGTFLATNSPAQAANAIPKAVVVQEGEGFILHLIRDRRQDKNFDGCSLELDDKEFMELGLKEKQLNEMTVKMIKSTPDECAVRVTHVYLKAPKRWHIVGTIKEDNRDVGDTVVVTVKPRATKCPTSSSKDADKLCTLVNKSTKEERRCDGSANKWNFDCFFFSEGSMEFRRENAPATDSGDSKVEIAPIYTPVKYEPQPHRAAILECVTPFKERIISCILEHTPSSRKFKPRVGLGNAKYSSLLTDFEKGVCQLEIEFPVPKGDTGEWNMTIKTMKPDPVECIFLVRLDYNELSKIANETTLIKTTKSEIKLPCAKDLHYPLTRCFLQSSDKRSLKFKTSAELKDMNCEFIIPVDSDREWTCGFNAPKPTQSDLIRKFKVERYDKEVIKMDIKKHLDGTITMECHEINDQPIVNCMFLSPTEMISVPENYNTYRDDATYKYRYYGNGFKRGHCGIRFPKDYNVEKGVWKCFIQQADKTETIYTETMHE